MSVDEHILIIGGTKGAGRAAINEFLEQGYKVSVIGRNKNESITEKAKYWFVDIGDSNAVSQVIKMIWETNGPITGLVFFQRFRGDSKTKWEGEIRTSVTATKNLIEFLVDTYAWNNGRIVVVSSINATLISKELDVSYHVCKAAINQMVRFYAVKLGPLNIRVNSISPGTFLKDESKAFFADNTELTKLYNKIIPLGRVGTAAEIAKTACFLCSSNSSYITGQNIIMDGGLSLVFQESLGRDLLTQF